MIVRAVAQSFGPGPHRRQRPKGRWRSRRQGRGVAPDDGRGTRFLRGAPSVRGREGGRRRMMAPPTNASASLPHNLEAEQALLGALLFDNAAYERLGDNLTAGHFFEPFHARLYATIEDHIRRGQDAEPIVMRDRFEHDPAFEELGGVRYLADLVDRAAPAARARRPTGDAITKILAYEARPDAPRQDDISVEAAIRSIDRLRPSSRSKRPRCAALLRPGRARRARPAASSRWLESRRSQAVEIASLATTAEMGACPSDVHRPRGP